MFFFFLWDDFSCVFESCYDVAFSVLQLISEHSTISAEVEASHLSLWLCLTYLFSVLNHFQRIHDVIEKSAFLVRAIWMKSTRWVWTIIPISLIGNSEHRDVKGLVPYNCSLILCVVLSCSWGKSEFISTWELKDRSTSESKFLGGEEEAIAVVCICQVSNSGAVWSFPKGKEKSSVSKACFSFFFFLS